MCRYNSMPPSFEHPAEHFDLILKQTVSRIMRFYRRKDIFDLHPLYGLHFFLLKFQVFDLHRFLIDEDMALFMVFKDLSAKFALIAPVVASHKPQLFRFRCDPKLFLSSLSADSR